MNKLNRQRWALLIVLLGVAGLRLLIAQINIDIISDRIALPIHTLLHRNSSGQVDKGNAQLASAQEQIRRLRSQLDLVDSSTQKTTSVEIVRRDIAGQRKTVWIDNSKNNVSANDVVLANGFLFGRVVEADGVLAEVQLLLDPLFRVTGQSEDQHGIAVNERGSLRFDLVPADLSRGALIFTDSIDRSFPVGVPVGLIGQSAESTSDVFKTYYVRLPYSIYDVQFVEVLANDR